MKQYVVDNEFRTVVIHDNWTSRDDGCMVLSIVTQNAGPIKGWESVELSADEARKLAQALIEWAGE